MHVHEIRDVLTLHGILESHDHATDDGKHNLIAAILDWHAPDTTVAAEPEPEPAPKTSRVKAKPAPVDDEPALESRASDTDF